MHQMQINVEQVRLAVDGTNHMVVPNLLKQCAAHGRRVMGRGRDGFQRGRRESSIGNASMKNRDSLDRGHAHSVRFDPTFPKSERTNGAATSLCYEEASALLRSLQTNRPNSSAVSASHPTSRISSREPGWPSTHARHSSAITRHASSFG